MPEVVGNSGYQQWLQLYHQALSDLPEAELNLVGSSLDRSNPQTILLRPQIESVWDPIAQDNNWEPFYDLLAQIRAGK